MWYNSLLERYQIPDFLLRAGLRLLLRKRLKDEFSGDAEIQQQQFNELLEELRNGPISGRGTGANPQHYALPAEFYAQCLGKHLKFSSAYWRAGVTDLDIAEEDMLELTCQRADLQNGQEILELGCGWGALSLFMAAKYPESEVTAVSNSPAQKIYIDQLAKDRELPNLTVITAEMNTFQILQQFDRVVAVGLFEHMRNYKLLLAKIAGFLKENGKLFVHLFSHQTLAYPFVVKEEDDWLGRHFFTGGMMPSNHLLSYFNEDLNLDKHWIVNGRHYSKTAEAWLKNMDSREHLLMPVLEKAYGKADAAKWWLYWRVFFLSFAEMFGFRKGNEWMVCHYLFKKKNCAKEWI